MPTNARVCSVEGCDNRHDAWGYCRAHGARWKRHGSPFAGGKQFPPRGEIQAYFHGTVLTERGNDCLLWPYGRHGAGYGEMYLHGRKEQVHRLVCERANGTPPSAAHEAAHSCGNGHNGCVNPTHLRWATKKENAADRRSHGTDTIGEKNGCSILKETDVRKIRELWPDMSQTEIARQYGITNQAIWAIVHRKNWAWL